MTVTATRVGVLTRTPPGKHTHAACPRCGRRRQVKVERAAELCRDCLSVDPQWGVKEP